MVERYVKQFKIKKEGTKEYYRVDVELILRKRVARDFEDLRTKEFIDIAFVGDLFYSEGRGRPLHISTGQIQDRARELMKDWKIPQELDFIFKVWEKYHHNTLRPGTRRQILALKKKDKTLLYASNYDKAVKYLKSIGLYEDRGYKYGSDWLAERVPDEIMTRLKQIFYFQNK